MENLVLPAIIKQTESLGAIGLANVVVNAVNDSPDGLKSLYDLEWSFEKKIETIASGMYGADHVEYTVLAKQQLS